MQLKLKDEKVKANGYIFKQLNVLTLAFFDIFDIDPKIDDEFEVIHSDKTIFKGYVNSINKIKTGYFQTILITNNKFDKENKDIKSYDDEDIVNIIKDILDLCKLKSDVKLDSFNINWIPKLTPALSLNNLFNTYTINKKKKVIWVDDNGKLIIDSGDAKDKKGDKIKNKIFERRGNVIACDNENVPNIFDTIEDRVITGYKLTSKELELYVK